MRDIARSISKLANPDKGLYSCRATVITINDDRTCNVKLVDTELEIEEVRLQAIPGLTEGVCITPTINSEVILLWIDDKNPAIVHTSEVDNISLLGDNLGGLVIAPELKTQLDKMTARIDGVIDALKNGVVIANDGGASYKTTIVTALNLIVEEEDFSNIENDKITQA